MTRRLIAFLGSILFFLAVSLSACLALFATETGTRWIIVGIQRFAPGDLQVAEVHGNLLGRIQLTELRYRFSEHNLEVGNVAVSWMPRSLFHRRLEVTELSATGVRYRGPEPETSEPETDGPIDLVLPIDIAITRADLHDIEIAVGKDSQRIRTITLSADSRRNRLRVHELTVQIDQAAASFRGQAELPSVENIDGTLSWQAATEQLGDLTGNGRIYGNLNLIAIEHGLTAPFALDTRGTINFESPEPIFEIHGTWQDLHWPFRGDAEVSSDEGRYKLAGTSSAYTLHIDGRIRGPQIPATAIDLRGKGSTDDFAIQRLTAISPEGNVDITGNVGWQETPSFQLTVSGTDIRLDNRLPDWPGIVSVDAKLRGRVSGGGLSGSADIGSLQGTLRGFPIAASGSLSIEGPTLTAKKITVNSGINKLRVDGVIDKRLALTFNVDAPKLAGIWPGLEGSLTSHGRLAGSRENPKIEATLTGKHLRFQDTAAETIEAELHLDPEREGTLKLRIDGKRINANDRKVESVKILADGKIRGHRIDGAIESGAGSIKISLGGSYQSQRWDGQIEALALSVPPTGNWTLEKLTSLTVASVSGKPSATLGKLCMRQLSAQICGEGAWSEGSDFSARGHLNEVPLSLLTTYLPDGISLEGLLDGRFEATRRDGRLTTAAELVPRPGQIVLDDETGPITVTYNRARADIVSRDGATRLAYALHLKDLGSSDGTIDVDPEDKLSGSLRAVLTDLSPVAALMPEVDKLAGTLRADAALNGTLDDPWIRANLDLEDARAEFPGLGMALRDMDLHAHSVGRDTLRLRGSALSGNGRIDIDGKAVLASEEGWPVSLTLKGERFEVARLPEAQVEITPNLEISVRNGNTVIAGTVLVPKMKIELKELPKSAVTVSDDEIIEGEIPTTEANAQPAPLAYLDAKVEVQLGKDVFFAGYGLSTSLSGNVEVSSRHGEAQAQGAIDMRDGKYRAYGQDLKIERGRFVFAGPIDNPNVDIRATRASKTDQVTAVLSVTGPVKKPKTRVFSEPPLPEKDALAYLLTGRPLDRTNKSQEALLARAALDYGLEHAQVFTQRIGIDELDVESDGSLEKSSVILGKYLSPDLYVGYVTNLFTSDAAVTLKYRLTKHLSAETRAGTTQSVDLLYNIETD